MGRFETSKVNLFKKENSRASKAEEKNIETKPSKKPSEKVTEVKLKVSDEVAPAKRMPVENVSYFCRMAQMRRIKIKEHYSEEIEKLYDRYCKDKDKDAKKKKALNTYWNKYHKKRQDHCFYSKLCKKYKVEPGEEYNGNDPDIKPDDEEKQEKLEGMQSNEQKPKTVLFGIPSRTKIKIAGSINPFKNDIFTEEKTEKNGGYNFEGNNGNLVNQKSSERKGLLWKESDKSLGRLNSKNLFSGEIISNTPWTNLFGNPIQKEKVPAPFSFSSVESNKEASHTSTIAEKSGEATIANANDILDGCDKSSLLKQDFELTAPKSQGKKTQTKDEKTASSENLQAIVGN